MHFLKLQISETLNLRNSVIRKQEIRKTGKSKHLRASSKSQDASFIVGIQEIKKQWLNNSSTIGQLTIEKNNLYK